MKKLYYRMLFKLTHKRIPKKQYGRCITCDGKFICSKLQICECNDNQQYESIYKDLKL